MTETPESYWERKYRVLLYIHNRGSDVTADDIAQSFGMSRIAAAVMLSRYKNEGIVLSKPMQKPNNPGPPYHVHKLSAKGEKRLQYFANKLATMEQKEAEAEAEGRRIEDIEFITRRRKIKEVD